MHCHLFNGIRLLLTSSYSMKTRKTWSSHSSIITRLPNFSRTISYEEKWADLQDGSYTSNFAVIRAFDMLTKNKSRPGRATKWRVRDGQDAHGEAGMMPHMEGLLRRLQLIVTTKT